MLVPAKIRSTGIREWHEAVEAFGKSAIVGVDGELEHASALIHTLHFGNTYRSAVGARSYLVAFNNTRGPANAPLLIPMMDKNDEGRRSHYLTLQFSISDAPAADELVVAIGGATGGRPHHRIGDRYKDLAELGNDVKNPAAVKYAGRSLSGAGNRRAAGSDSWREHAGARVVSANRRSRA
ncbi:hypothetical protein AWB79_04316 [Caballeronia hypogeia]|uniref:Amino acid synthesis family protein n=1 Tax=Caballeronia hypogeia TaxID=1777140 RepID=A0A158BVU3_9BURK|nr:hypothetical protein AWB79_04316 [Caballeronia hypogeia]